MQIKYNDKLTKAEKSLINGIYIYNHPVKTTHIKESTVESKPKTDPVRLHDIMTPDEVEKYLSISWMTLKRWTRTGKIKAIRINERGDRRYLREDVLSFLEGKK